MILSIVYGAMLLYLSVEDFKKLNIPLLPGLGLVIFGIVWNTVTDSISVKLILIGSIPAIVLAIMLLTGIHIIEAGDALIICGIGTAFGIDTVCITFFLASVFCGIYMAFLMPVIKTLKKEKIAFVPFLSAGLMFTLLISG